jgi:hypothetical protein
MAVGISLAQVAAPGATPITPNGTAEKIWLDNFAKLGVPNISQQDRNSIAILGLIYKLNNAGGANYKSNHAGLIQDAQVFSGGVSMLDPETARAVNDWNSGNVADGTLSTDVPTLLKEARDISQIPASRQEKIIAFLRAQMRT